jgi:hypothetical protein
MPSTCCVVQDCSNKSNATAGIFLHISPKNKTAVSKSKLGSICSDKVREF